MKVVILYRPKSEQGTAVDTFVHDYQVRHGSKHIELVNVDERDGIAMASLYDIMDFPAIMVLQTDGTSMQIWQGKQLPRIDEVASYTLER